MPDLPFLVQWKRRQLLCQVPSLSSASGLLCHGGRHSQGARRAMAREGFSSVPRPEPSPLASLCRVFFPRQAMQVQLQHEGQVGEVALLPGCPSPHCLPGEWEGGDTSCLLLLRRAPGDEEVQAENLIASNGKAWPHPAPIQEKVFWPWKGTKVCGVYSVFCLPPHPPQCLCPALSATCWSRR